MTLNDEYHKDDEAKDDDTGDRDTSEDERKLRQNQPVFLPRYEASGRISPDRNFPPSTGKVEVADDAGDTEEDDADDIIEEEEGGDDAGDGIASIEEDEADATLPPASLASTIASASANSLPCFMLGRLPICFLTPFLRLLLRWCLKTFISALISVFSVMSLKKGCLRQ